MTQDEIIRIYLQVANEFCDGKEWCLFGVSEPLQRFVSLVAEATREKAAQIADEVLGENNVSAAIRSMK